MRIITKNMGEFFRKPGIESRESTIDEEPSRYLSAEALRRVGYGGIDRVLEQVERTGGKVALDEGVLQNLIAALEERGDEDSAELVDRIKKVTLPRMEAGQEGLAPVEQLESAGEKYRRKAEFYIKQIKEKIPKVGTRNLEDYPWRGFDALLAWSEMSDEDFSYDSDFIDENFPGWKQADFVELVKIISADPVVSRKMKERKPTPWWSGWNNSGGSSRSGEELDRRQYARDVLGVGRDADQKEIQKAFHELSKKHHPDANPGDEEAEARFKKISAAYRDLSV